jgi:hypothetical protein
MDTSSDAPRSADGNYWWNGTDWVLVAENFRDAASDPQPQAANSTGSTDIRIHSIRLWVNVFIPDHKVSGAGHCFLGDDRGFDPATTASSRLQADVTITGLGTAEAKMATPDIHCGLTRMVDCTTEEVLDSAIATPAGTFTGFSAGNTVADPEGGVHDNANAYVATVSLDVSAADPLVAVAPTVGADLYFSIDPVGGTVTVNGVVDHWPAFEGYASVDGGAPITLFQLSPASGTDPYTLLQPRDAPVNAHVLVA